MIPHLQAAYGAARVLGPFALALFLAGAAAAQTPQSMFDCEIQARECEMRAREQSHGNDPCSAYSRCQAIKMCEAQRCVCKRTHGSADPALTYEAQAMCYAILKPHAGNSCDGYIDACTAWFNAQHPQKPKPQKPKPQKPSAHGGPPTQGPPSGAFDPATLVPPDQQPRFR